MHTYPTIRVLNMDNYMDNYNRYFFYFLGEFYRYVFLARLIIANEIRNKTPTNF